MLWFSILGVACWPPSEEYEGSFFMSMPHIPVCPELHRNSEHPFLQITTATETRLAAASRNDLRLHFLFSSLFLTKDKVLYTCHKTVIPKPLHVDKAPLSANTSGVWPASPSGSLPWTSLSSSSGVLITSPSWSLGWLLWWSCHWDPGCPFLSNCTAIY